MYPINEGATIMFTVLMTCDDCDEEIFTEILDSGDNISVPDHECAD